MSAVAHYKHAPDRTLSDADAKAIARELHALQVAASREILNAPEAAAYVGKPSIESFYLWRKKYQVRACGHGRYSLRSLKAAME